MPDTDYIVRYIIDLTRAYENYLSTAPGIVLNYLPFHECLDTIINTPDTPSFDRIVPGEINQLILSHKRCGEEYLEEHAEFIENFVMSYCCYIDKYIEDVLKGYQVEYSRYKIFNWLNPYTAVLAVSVETSSYYKPQPNDNFEPLPFAPKIVHTSYYKDL